MINIIVGKPGQGKTYFAVKQAWKAYKLGLPVYYNMPFLDFKPLEKSGHSYGTLNHFDTMDEFVKIRGGIVILDECQTLFNSRDWKNLPPQLQYKFQQHRKHRGSKGEEMHIWGTTQNLKRIDTVVRELANSVYECKKKLGLFVVKEFDIDDIDSKKRESLSLKMFILDKKLADCYDTFAEIKPF